MRLNGQLVKIAVCGGVIAVGVWLAIESTFLEPARREQRAIARRLLAEHAGILVVAGIDRGDPELLRDPLAQWINRHHDAGVRALTLVDQNGTHILGVGLDDRTSSPQASDRGLVAIEIPILRGDKIWGRASLWLSRDEWWLNRWIPPLARDGVMVLFLVITPLVMGGMELHRRKTRTGRERRLSEQRARQTLDTFSEGVVVLDSDRRVVFANNAFVAFANPESGASGGTLLDDDWEVIDGKHEEHSTIPMLPWQYVLESSNSVKRVRLKQKRDDTGSTFLVNAIPIPGSGSTIVGVLATFEDISTIEMQRVELARARDAANQASQTKSYFLASMSHEIRTPLNGVIGTLDLLADTRLSGQQPQLIDMARISADSLMSLISDVLDVSKIEAGQLELFCEDFDLAQVATQATTVLKSKAASKGLALECFIDPKIDRYVHGDAGRLRQILINLLGNAVKFTETGRVGLEFALVEKQGEVESIQVSVSDTGIGIPRDKLDRLFKPFNQVDASIHQRFGGTGLGLALSAELIRMMGGDIRVDSELGVGTTFVATLPFRLSGNDLACPGQRASSRATEPSLSGVTVLVVEDNPINQFVTTEILRRAGAKTEVAQTGRRAIECVQVQRFDVVLMDCSLPDSDGFAVTRAIRSIDGGNWNTSQVPIIALTAKAMSGDRDACLQAGMNDYVTKPVNAHGLLTAIGTALQLNGAFDDMRVGDAPSRPNTQCGLSDPGESGMGIGFDMDVLLRASANDADVACQVLDLFEATSCNAVTELERALDERDRGSIEAIAHRLKGGAAHAGAIRVVEAADRTESHAVEVGFRDLAAMVESIRHELAQCIATLPLVRSQLTRALNSNNRIETSDGQVENH